MLNRVIKVSFAAVGVVTGFTVTNTFFTVQNIMMAQNLKNIIFSGISLLVGVLFYSTGSKIIEMVLKILDKLEVLIQNMTLYEITLSAVGLIVGLIIANLVTIPVVKTPFIGVPISIAANLLIGCAGIYIAVGKRNESLHSFFSSKNSIDAKGGGSSSAKIIDTSAIIDGRIVDICRSGFLEGELIVPSFVLEELRHIADSSDPLKRNRGRRGLDVLNILQQELNFPVKIEDFDTPEGFEVDNELLNMTRKYGGKVITLDYNLNKVASIQQVPVLNINELANAVKPIALPGEDMIVQVIKDGKENGQGIGYLDDGTMIVIDGGRKFIGENIKVTVTSVLQTAAGRMIFAKPKLGFEGAV